MQIIDGYKEEAFKTDLTLRNFYNPLDPLYRRSTRLRNKDINLKIRSIKLLFLAISIYPNRSSPLPIGSIDFQFIGFRIEIVEMVNYDQLGREKNAVVYLVEGGAMG